MKAGRENRRRSLYTRRALLVGGVQVGAFGLLGEKLYQAQIVDGQRYAMMATSNRVSTRLTAPPRARLFDRAGIVVASNKLNWRALLMAEQAQDVDATLDSFSAILPLADRERARIERELRRRRRYIPVLVREYLDWEEMARIEVAAPNLPGILVDVGTTRQYQFSALLAHVVGYVAPPNDRDVASDAMLALPGIRVGRAGLEKFHDAELRGGAGAIQLEVNAVGRVIRELDRQEGKQGADITLTLDTGLQQAVATRLGDESASCVVMDCRNGAVLAMVSNPSFDPSLFNAGISQAQWIEWTKDRKAPLINKAAAGLYAPGSTFKMVVALAGLEARAISPYDGIDCPGYLDYGTARFHCWKRGGHGVLDLQGGLKNSCDVYFYNVALRTGMDPIAAMAKRFGLGVKLDIELPGARSGFVPTRAWRVAHGKAWNIGDTIVHGIGQGFLQLTPLSLCTMVSRIATGRAVQPHLTRTVGDALQEAESADTWPGMELGPHALQAVREGMWAVVNEHGGSAPLARLSLAGVQMAGKTGSSQVHRVSRALRESGTFNSANLPWELRPHALFVAFAPYDAPRYALSVVVEHGNAGADAAAPIARDIMTEALKRDPAGAVATPQRVASE
jgi:penicillin-binding protein 2